MPPEQLTREWQSRFKAVEREYLSARNATDYLLTTSQQNPGVLAGDLKFRDVMHMSERLEGTYLIRLFAEFETALRLFSYTPEQATSKADSGPAERFGIDVANPPRPTHGRSLGSRVPKRAGTRTAPAR